MLTITQSLISPSSPSLTQNSQISWNYQIARHKYPRVIYWLFDGPAFDARFANFVTVVCLSFDLDLSHLLHGFVKVLSWICQSYHMDFSKLNLFQVLWQTQPSWSLTRFHSLLKLLLWTRGVDWVKAFNALGPLNLWQSFIVEFYGWDSLLYFIGSIVRYICVLSAWKRNHQTQVIVAILQLSSCSYGPFCRGHFFQCPFYPCDTLVELRTAS